MKKILVYPCGTEIGLEIYRALMYSPHYILYGGSSNFDHGQFVYLNHVNELPFITDVSSKDEIIEFNNLIKKYEFDYIYPAMDGVLTVFSKYRKYLSPVVIAPEYCTCEITRSKFKTYELFQNYMPIPDVYINWEDIKNYPVFLKPDVGQGSVGVRKINSKIELLELKSHDERQLVLEFLPGKEYTVDCFTNESGKLIYFRGRERKRIKTGISVNAVFVDHPDFEKFATVINDKLRQRGAWFFQLKEDKHGKLKLLEIASRIAGSSAIERCVGVNLPLLSLNLFSGISVDDVVVNDYPIEMDRALGNTFRIDVSYQIVYIDFDDTIVLNGKINLVIIQFLYQCINQKKKIILLSKHKGDLKKELEKYKIQNLFDEIIHIPQEADKSDYIKYRDAIFIDDSYGERKKIRKKCGLYVFDTHMVECLMEGE